MSNIIQFNGREIDISKALPLTLGDWVKLEQEGVTPSRLTDGRASDLVAVLFTVLNKADNAVTREEVMSISLTDPIIKSIFDDINKTEENVNRPLSITSTSSPPPMGGAAMT